VHAPIATLADDSGRGAMDDRCTVDVCDDATLLDPVEERNEAGLGTPANLSRAECAALQGADARGAGGLVAPLQLLQRGERVLYVDRRSKRGTNAARCGAKTRVRSNG
jgi:hypothetical protein